MSSSFNPLVSVIITTYNRPDMLGRAIDSVINQTYKNIEIVVVDDNNPDTETRKQTELLMSSYKEFPNIKYIKHPKNKNGAAARNTGIKNSSGEIVSFLDDDDWYLPEKIEMQVQYLAEHPEFDAVYCGWNKFNKDWMYTKEGDLTYEILSTTNPIITNTILMYKEAAVKCGGWDERFRRNQEPAFLLRFFKQGYKIGVVNKVLVQFDLSDRSNVLNPKKNEENIRFFLDTHIEQINECEKKIEGAKKYIYSYRYKNVLFSYLKHKDWKNAFKLYIRLVKKIPFTFNKVLITELKKKLLN